MEASAVIEVMVFSNKVGYCLRSIGELAFNALMFKRIETPLLFFNDRPEDRTN